MLLDRNVISGNKTNIETAELEAYIRQKPNRYLLQLKSLNLKFFPYYRWIYTSINQEKMLRKKIERDIRYDNYNADALMKNATANEKRIKKGKKPKPVKLKDKSSPTWRETWLEIGEMPAFIDSQAIKSSKEQLEKFLDTKGYFNSHVSDSIVIKKQRATVYYKIHTQKPYHFRNISFWIEDPTMNYHLGKDTQNCLIKPGMQFDVNLIQQERERIVRHQKNNGYFKFGQEYIYFELDSTIGNRQIDVKLVITKFQRALEEMPDSIITEDHTRYYIGNIFIITDYDLLMKSQYYSDTIPYKDYFFLTNRKKIRFRKKDIINKIYIHPNQLFNQEFIEESYARLSDFKAFKNININIKTVPTQKDRLDCYVLLTPVLKQTFTMEAEGTNTSGNLGAAGSFVYQNRNSLNGGEVLELKLRGGLIAQKNFNVSESDETFGFTNLKAFNTFEFGPEMNFYVPKPLFPFNLFHYRKNAGPQTIFHSSVSFQQNNRYVRTLTNASYGFQFNDGKFVRHFIAPIEANLIVAGLSQDFLNQLDNSRNLFLKYSFQDHITTVTRYTFSYNNQINQNLQSRKVFSYFKTNIESSGNIMRGIYNLAGAPKDQNGSYTIDGIPFAQFLRFDADLRIYKFISKLGRLVFRFAGGVGKPLHNLRVLPYEKSFFAGGPNSIRAWRARSVGPGSYNQTDDKNFDKIGDAQLEMNFEYRFNIYKWINGAWFVDAGNIWLRKKDEYRPNAEFALNRFYREFATGTGLGLRADFSFFILRFDAAIRVYDPALLPNKRWVISYSPFKTVVGNFGIGYPF